jgi:arginase
MNNPKSSESGNVHGMPLAAALGLGGAWFQHGGLRLPAADPARTVIVGARAIDPDERELIRAQGIRVFTMSEIDRIGIERTMTEALARVAGPGFVHLSLDLDALDPELAPGVGTPVPGGLTYREAHLACELVAESGLVGSVELVEVNPILDRENATASIAVELAASALGKTIL